MSVSESAECGYGCQHMVAAMNRVTSRVCESKETTTHVVILFSVLLFIQLLMFTGMCVYTMRQSGLCRWATNRFWWKDEVKKKLVSERTVSEMDDAEL